MTRVSSLTAVVIRKPGTVHTTLWLFRRPRPLLNWTYTAIIATLTSTSFKYSCLRSETKVVDDLNPVSDAKLLRQVSHPPQIQTYYG